MKYLKTYDAYSFTDEEFQEIVNFMREVAALIPSKSNFLPLVKLNTISPIVKYCFFYFYGEGIYKNKKYWIEVVFGKNKSAHDILVYGSESEINYRKEYTEETFVEVFRDSICRYIGLDNKPLNDLFDAYINGKNFGLI